MKAGIARLEEGKSPGWPDEIRDAGRQKQGAEDFPTSVLRRNSVRKNKWVVEKKE